MSKIFAERLKEYRKELSEKEIKSWSNSTC